MKLPMATPSYCSSANSLMSCESPCASSVSAKLRARSPAARSRAWTAAATSGCFPNPNTRQPCGTGAVDSVSSNLQFVLLPVKWYDAEYPQSMASVKPRAFLQLPGPRTICSALSRSSHRRRARRLCRTWLRQRDDRTGSRTKRASRDPQCSPSAPKPNCWRSPGSKRSPARAPSATTSASKRSLPSPTPRR